MFSTVDKALVAGIMAGAFLLSHFGIGVPTWFTQEWVTTMLGVLTPVVTFLVPNKA